MTKRSSLSSSTIPLREPTFYILLSLASGEKHGYAILKEVEDLSQGEIHLSTGTLYEAIARLLDQRLIIRIDTEETPDFTQMQGPPRKTYQLTRNGRIILDGEVGRLQNLLAVARQQLDKAGA
jgi:DNA-binding PadR family transcriptional regulator